MPRQYLAIFPVAALLLIVLNAARGEETAQPKLPERLKQVLAWLPPDAETLIVANGPFDIPVRLDGIPRACGVSVTGCNATELSKKPSRFEACNRRDRFHRGATFRGRLVASTKKLTT